MRLTDISVRALPVPAQGQKTYYDAILPSFGCRVSQGGTRTFIVIAGADRQRTTIGRFPVISLAEARTEAKRILAERTLGKHRPRTIAWDDAVDLYLAECKLKNKERTVADYDRLLKKYFPFKRRQLASMTYEDIESKLARIVAPSERNHALVAAKVFLSWAQKPPRRFVPSNPCEGMAPTKRPPRKRVLKDYELRAVYRTALTGTDTYSKIVALLVTTGQRRGEIGALQREWVGTDTITLPDWFTKNGFEHTFPFGSETATILKSVPQTDSAYLFPAARDHVRGKPTTTFNGWAKAKPAFDEKCGVSGWTLHDLRRTFATRLAEMKVAPHVIERLLNHKLGSISNKTAGMVSDVAGIYNLASYMPEMRQAISLWDAKLSSLTQQAAA